jgi:ADP-ribosylation factor protein 1
MGGAVSYAKRAFSREQEHKWLMTGLDAVGKTSILYKMKGGEVKTTIPTIGFNVEQCVYGNSVEFTAWDVGGRDKIRPLLRHFYGIITAIVFVVDSGERERLEFSKDELAKILCEDENNGKPLLVFANKQDLPDAMTVQEVTEGLGLHSLRDRHWYIQGTSALTGDGIVEGFSWLKGTAERVRSGRVQTFAKVATPAVAGAPTARPAEAGSVDAGKGGSDHDSVADSESTADTETPEGIARLAEVAAN